MPPDPKRPSIRPYSHHHHSAAAAAAAAAGHMKLHHRRAQNPSNYKPLLLIFLHPNKYLRWLLCFSLSLYFFYFSLFTTTPLHPHKPTSLRQTTTLPSRVLVETGLKPNKLTQNPKLTATATATAGGMDPMSLRIYVYDLPSRYNRDWLANPRCATHLFAAEVALHRALFDSPIRPVDPRSADFFFVPVYVSCNFSTPNGFPALGHARSLLSSAVDLISSRYPFWNRSAGADHLFVASHDFGACFHAMEDVAVAGGIPEFLKRSIILQTFGVNHPHVCQDVEHVLIPPYVPPEIVRLSSPASATERDIFAFFRGKMEVHPKNISGQIYSNGLRTEIWRRYGGSGGGARRRFYVKRKRFDGFRAEIGRSVFCLCPRGWAPWSPRVVEAVALGCVPVVVADGIRLPFPEAVRWPEISLAVAERDVGRLEVILEHVARTNISDIQRNLWEPRKKEALLFNRQIRRGDATWHVLKALTGKLDRSWRQTETLSSS